MGSINPRDLDNWARIILPDGRVGFINKQEIELVRENQDYITQESMLIANAISMIGIPYLWGGNSSKGNDCSGFTQTVFMASGIQLPRDARQQALEGIEITPNGDWSNIREGDLLFFGKEDRVTHVGISLGKKEFIHQGGKVAVNSLDDGSEYFSSDRLKSFLFIKRILRQSS